MVKTVWCVHYHNEIAAIRHIKYSGFEWRFHLKIVSYHSHNSYTNLSTIEESELLLSYDVKFPSYVFFIRCGSSSFPYIGFMIILVSLIFLLLLSFCLFCCVVAIIFVSLVLFLGSVQHWTILFQVLLSYSRDTCTFFISYLMSQCR